jgi:hypothetical protein
VKSDNHGEIPFLRHRNDSTREQEKVLDMHNVGLLLIKEAGKTGLDRWAPESIQ